MAFCGDNTNCTIHLQKLSLFCRNKRYPR
jgi:hypothetical protein